MRWEWGQGWYSLVRVLLGHLDTPRMNSELGGEGLTPLSAGHGWESADPWAGSPGRCFTFAGWEGAEAETDKI